MDGDVPMGKGLRDPGRRGSISGRAKPHTTQGQHRTGQARNVGPWVLVWLVLVLGRDQVRFSQARL